MEVYKLKDITENKSDIQIEFGRLNTVMDWCREHCGGSWSITDCSDVFYQSTYSNFVNNYQFKFSDSRDLVTFNLKFK